ncbi:3-oxoacyl-ACP synthase III family protein [Streptomyces sp. I05A-00742]|uniref:3-oxoacyl-ACP synthase III family protein n=1 Tax=Streptomyces sp. I05A-00742 TaxID=2732853 RepID=UPI00148979DF|nr:3-oxoacyl-[acyl-carrier-protein] synthase III C-terminal domain-containing protein [Streptomyces sp. I05A-00742]
MTRPRYSRMSAVAAHLPERRISTDELEDIIQENSPEFRVPRGMIRRMTGVAHRYLRPDDQMPSDLAVTAAGKALADAGWQPGDLDLIVFAAVSMDLLEPATAHVVAAKLGAGCPVFDVKNACNSLLNGLEVGDALIRSGAYRRVLVCCGECPTHILRKSVSGPREFLDAMVGYTVSDVGAAVLLEASDEPGLLGFGMRAISSEWPAGAVPLPGVPSGASRLRFDLPVMARAVHRLVDEETLAWSSGRTGLPMTEVSMCCAHLAAGALADDFSATVGIPRSKLVTTITSHGNTASATLPLQLDLALREGRAARGDTVLLAGLASGISLGFLWLRL